MEVIESKKEEIVEKVIDQIESRKDDIVKKIDEAEVKVEETVEKVADDIEKKVEDILDNAPPEVKKVLDALESNIIEAVDGRLVSCSCFGFLWSLRITRKSPETPPSKSEDTQNKEKLPATLSIRTPV